MTSELKAKQNTTAAILKINEETYGNKEIYSILILNKMTKENKHMNDHGINRSRNKIK